MAESDEFNGLVKLMRATSAEAVPAAENAAAIIFRDAAIAAAPRKSGQLAASIKIIEGKPLKMITGDTRQRLFVGPEKKKGYYGYWVEKGWVHPTGSRLTYTTTRGDRWHAAGHTYTTGRLGRLTGKAAHSQMGTGGKKIDARPWFEKAVRGADTRATQAAETAFNAKLAELDK